MLLQILDSEITPVIYFSKVDKTPSFNRNDYYLSCKMIRKHYKENIESENNTFIAFHTAGVDHSCHILSDVRHDIVCSKLTEIDLQVFFIFLLSYLLFFIY